jgi:ABC-type bacteriocin/lantibiotic exporter with double-glycine peptidase domain
MKLICLPQLRQTYDFDCGSKALQSILAYYGIEIREDKIMNTAKTNKDGTSPQGIKRAISKYGLQSKSGKMTIENLKRYIDLKIPVLILLQAWPGKDKTNWEKDWLDGHWVVAIGYTKEKIIFEDPWSIYKTYLKYDELLKRWHDKGLDGKKYLNFGIAVFGRRPVFKRDKLIHMD